MVHVSEFPQIITFILSNKIFSEIYFAGYCILVNTEVFLRHLNECRIFSLTKSVVGAGLEEGSSFQSLFCHLHSAKLHGFCCKAFFGPFQKLVCLEKKKKEKKNNNRFYLRLFTMCFFL